MGILDRFKKKNTPENETTQPETAQPENIQPETVTEPVAQTPQPPQTEAEIPAEIPTLPFEALMKEAVNNVNVRYDFYRNLPLQQVYVITSGKNAPQGQQVLEENAQVELATFSDGKIPFFTALPRMFEKGVIKGEVPYMEMKAGDLLNLTKGATLVLNPFSDFGKELIPEEIAQVLDGSILGGAIHEVAVPNNTEVRIGQPSSLPTAMLDKLITVFSNRDDVNEAYLAVVEMPATGNPPRFLLALDISGDRQVIFEETGRTAQQFLKQGESIDIMQLAPENGISAYFNDQQPFYKK